MERKPFKFRGFEISDQKSAQKIGFDAIIIGTLAGILTPSSILDIGCGCGIISMALASRFGAINNLTAIDIDLKSCEETIDNFKNNQIENFTVLNSSLGDFTNESKECFDLIVCNPPYHLEEIYSPKAERNLSRNAISLSPADLIKSIDLLLSANGEAWIISPLSYFNFIKPIAIIEGLYPFIEIKIHTKTKKSEERILFGFSRNVQLNPNRKSIYM